MPNKKCRVFLGGLLGLLCASIVHAQSVASAPLNLETISALSLREEVRVGSLNDVSIGFTRIGGVKVASDGRVFVLETADRQVRVYSAQGARLHSIGRAGRGPGEFQGPLTFGLKGDTVWVSDRGNDRITLFSTEGRLLRTIPATGFSVAMPARSGMTLSVVPHSLRFDGTLSSSIRGGMQREATGGPDSVRVPLVRFSLDGTVIDTVAWTTYRTDGNSGSVRVGGTVMVVPTALNHTPLISEAEGTSVTVYRPEARSAGAAEFTVRRGTSAGATTYERRFRYRPQPVAEGFVDSLIADRLGNRNWANRSGLETALRNAIPTVSFHPPVSIVVAGADGSALLRRSNTASDGRARWISLGPDGNARGEIRLQGQATVEWIEGDLLWVVELDSFDVPWLVRYRILRS